MAMLHIMGSGNEQSNCSLCTSIRTTSEREREREMKETKERERERFTFANAPVSLRDTLSVNVLYQFAATYALRRPVALNIRLSRYKPR